MLNFCIVVLEQLFQQEQSLGIMSKFSIIIEENVYIGAYAMILGNVKIGHDAVIGAGAVVLNDVEPFGTYVTTTELRRIK